MKTFIVLFFFLPTFIFASETKQSQLASEFSSPVTTKAKYVFWTGASITLALTLLEDSIDDPLQYDISEDKPLGNYSHLGYLMGQMIPNAIYILGMYGNYQLTNNQQSKDRSILMTKTSLYSTVVTTALKYTVREQRPNGEGRVSFPSGHTSAAFSFASVVGAEHDLIYSIPAYVMATFIGMSRMNDNAHYLHDVTAGATIGISYGLGLYYHSKSHKESEMSSFWQVLPTDNLDGAMGIWSKLF